MQTHTETLRPFSVFSHSKTIAVNRRTLSHEILLCRTLKLCVRAFICLGNWKRGHFTDSKSVGYWIIHYKSLESKWYKLFWYTICSFEKKRERERARESVWHSAHFVNFFGSFWIVNESGTFVLFCVCANGGSSSMLGWHCWMFTRFQFVRLCFFVVLILILEPLLSDVFIVDYCFLRSIVGEWLDLFSSSFGCCSFAVVLAHHFPYDNRNWRDSTVQCHMDLGCMTYGFVNELVPRSKRILRTPFGVMEFLWKICSNRIQFFFLFFWCRFTGNTFIRVPHSRILTIVRCETKMRQSMKAFEANTLR